MLPSPEHFAEVRGCIRREVVEPTSFAEIHMITQFPAILNTTEGSQCREITEQVGCDSEPDDCKIPIIWLRQEAGKVACRTIRQYHLHSG